MDICYFYKYVLFSLSQYFPISHFIAVQCLWMQCYYLFSDDTPAQNDIAVIGAPLEASRAGVDADHSTLILIDEISSHGILFAYAVYFRFATEVSLQVWRRAEDDETGVHRLVEGQFRFVLVQELRITPSLIGEEVVSRIIPLKSKMGS